MANEYKTWPLLSDFRDNIKKELLRRKNETFGEGNKPRSVWVRAVSNAVIPSSITAQEARSGQTGYELKRDLNIMVGGLLLPSGATRGGFEPVYQRVAKGRQIFDRPMPGIDSISVQSKGEFGSLRKITINWICPSIEDLDILMPYWLSPGISVIVEWGWANIGQYPIPIDVDNVDDVVDLYRNPAKIMKKIVLREGSSKSTDYAGNQDFFIGIITNFSWNMNEDGSYTCNTELTTFGETMLALNLNKDVKKKGVDKDEKKTSYGIREYIERAFNKDNLEGQINILEDKRDIAEATKEQTSHGGGASTFSVTTTPDVEGDIYVSWDFIEKRIINDHGCPEVGAEKWFAFEMDSSETKLSNDRSFLYSRDSDILINNNGNPAMKQFTEISPNNFDSNGDGYLKNVYVKRSFIIETFNNSETLEEAIKVLINKIRAASFDLWDLKLQTDALGENKSKIIDQKFVSRKGFDEVSYLKSNNLIFNFGGYSGKSIIRNIGFTSKMTNQIALTQFFGRNKVNRSSNKTVYSDDSDVGVHAVFGATVDRILQRLRFKEENVLKENPPKEESTKEGQRLNDVGGIVDWNSGDKPKNSEWFYYKDEDDIKIIDQYLRRTTKENILKNIPIYPLEISVGIDGISGILPGNIFTLDNIPKAYRETGVFQIVEISHEISSDDWVTTVRAFFRPVDVFEGSGDSFKEKNTPTLKIGKEEESPRGNLT